MSAIQRAFALVLSVLLLLPSSVAFASATFDEAPPPTVENRSVPAKAPVRPGTLGPVNTADPGARGPATRPIANRPPPTAAPQYDEWYEAADTWVRESLLPVAQKVGIALLILLIGWLVASIVRRAVYGILQRTTLDDKLADWLRLDLLFEKGDGDRPKNQVERFFAAVVYYILMALVVVATLQYSGFSQAAEPINNLINIVLTEGLRRLGVAILYLVGAWAAATILGKLATLLVGQLRLDAWIGDLTTRPVRPGDPAPRKFSENVGSVVKGLVMIVGLAAAFDALEITPISEPLHNAINRVIGILPSLGVAIVILFAGWVISRLVRDILQGLLGSLGIDRLAERLRISSLLGKWTASAFLAAVAAFFIMLQAALAAINELGLETLSLPITNMMTQFWNLLPGLAVSALIIFVGVWVGRILRELVANGLRNLGFDGLMARLGLGTIAKRDDRLGEPSELVGFFAQTVVILLAVAQAFENLELITWAGYVNYFLSWTLKHVLVAFIIIGVGFAIGNYVRDVITARQEASGESSFPWMGMFARYVVLVFASTMAIHQLGVAENFVLLTFGLLFGSLCLAAALAFGLGARDVASEIVRTRFDHAKANERARSMGGGGSSYDSGYFARPGAASKPDDKNGT